MASQEESLKIVEMILKYGQTGHFQDQMAIFSEIL